MTHEQAFDAQEFASNCLLDAVGAINDAYASCHVTNLGDENSLGGGLRVAASDAEESTIREVGYGFIGQAIYDRLFDDSDVQKSNLPRDAATAPLILQINALIERYDPQLPRWRAEDYADYDDFWTTFNEDFAWSENLAERIVAQDAPSFFLDVLPKLREIANSPTPE